MQPMKLKPAFKDYLWGGTRLIDEYNKVTLMRPVAESWEVSTHADGPSVIKNGAFAGQTLTQVLRLHPQYIGENTADFPVLIKIIDARESLSVQVHPSDEYALPNEGEHGKNEMWYVMDAEPGAELIVGFHEILSAEEIKAHIENNTILDVANKISVKKGDCFAIPAGMLHAIGAGTLIAEVQQNSNITYRVYDYDRRNDQGNLRELHTEKALQVIDSSLETKNLGENPSYPYPGCIIQPLLNWKFFVADKIQVRTVSQHYASEKTFHALLVLEGSVTYRSHNNVTHLDAGESLFIPANIGEYKLEGPGTLLRVRQTEEVYPL